MKDSARGCCDSHTTGLVPYDEVRAELLSLIRPSGRGVTVSLATATGRVLAQDVAAVLPLPPRDNSAVDGYALGPVGESSGYQIKARTAAGEVAPDDALGAGQAVRIFTGAPIPPGTFAVAMQEDCESDGNLVTPGLPVHKAQHIRRGGEDIRTGEKLMPAGTNLDPRHIALLAAMGLAEITVTAPIRVAIFSSGKELVEPGTKLGAASIHDSNRWMLRALLADPGIEILDYGILPDNRDAIFAALKQAGDEADIVLSSGGVSVGEEDHIFAAMSEVGHQPFQRRMAVKPGKPVVFGRIGRAVFVGLPGNPVAALVSFTLLARPCLDILAGSKPGQLAAAKAISGFDWSRKTGRTEYFPARIIGQTETGLPVLERLGTGGSALLKPLIAADGFARVGQDVEKINLQDPLDWFAFGEGFRL